MNDSYDRTSFRDGWTPTGFSRDATLSFQRLTEFIELPLNVVYFFKPISTFKMPSLNENEKFDAIDGYIAAELDCDPCDVFTVSSATMGPLILVSEPVLRRANVALPRWKDSSSRRGKTRLASVAALG
jgi:hypothetical protein